MNWEAVGAIGEVLGAVAVVVTLLYLAVQIKQNSVLQKEDARYHMLQNQITAIDGLLQHPDVMRAQYGIPPDDTEATLTMRGNLWAIGIFARWQWEYLRSLEGVYHARDVPVAAFRREFDASPPLRKQWDMWKPSFDPDFVRFVERDVIGPPPAA